MSAVSATVDILTQPTTSAYAVTSGRLWSLLAVLMGLTGVVIGGLTLARFIGGTGTGRPGASTALGTGLLGALIGGLVVRAAQGGPGTGYGIVGGFVAVVVGLIAAMLGGVALVRSRRAL